jgi:hypothetical protein
MVNIKREFALLWNESRVLTATGLLMLAALALFGAGLLFDARTITGAPAWLKPAKFAISTSIFTLSIVWLFRYLTVWRPFLRMMAWTVSVVLVLEVGIIALQAGRGVSSHFNTATRFDGIMFAIMGVAISVLWLATVGVFAALLRQRFQNPAWGWWLRLGVLITVIGSAAGGSMLRKTPYANGGHTVGAPDGGPGLPGTGWSTEHGDLRVAHFMGLHGMQVLPVLGWLTMRRRYCPAVQTRFAFIAGTSYTALTCILWWQALRGQSLVAPDAATLIAVAVWLAATGIGVRVAQAEGRMEAAENMA